MSEHFKTLREPLIEQQKKTDEKQDRVIEQLKKNQSALTSGIQDIMTLNRDLPQITPDEYTRPRELPAPGKKITIANISQKFNEKDLEIIRENKLLTPTELLELNVDELEKYVQEVKDKSKKIAYAIGEFKKKKPSRFNPSKSTGEKKQ